MEKGRKNKKKELRLNWLEEKEWSNMSVNWYGGQIKEYQPLQKTVYG